MQKSHIRFVLALALALVGAAPAFAHNMNMTDWLRMMEKLRQQQANQETPWVSGRVVKINSAAQSVSISHGAIKSIGMPAMTMTFGVTEPSRSTIRRQSFCPTLYGSWHLARAKTLESPYPKPAARRARRLT